MPMGWLPSCGASSRFHSGGTESRKTVGVWCDKDIQVSIGEVVVITGPSGIGKTSLAHAAVSAGWRAGLVYQDASGLEHLDIRDNLRLVTGDDERIEKLVHDVGLDEPYRNRVLAGNLSGGEKRRMTVVRGLLGDCDVLWLDEPDAGLDSESSIRLAQSLADVKDRVLVVVTHGRAFAERLRPSLWLRVERRGAVLYIREESDKREYAGLVQGSDAGEQPQQGLAIAGLAADTGATEGVVIGEGEDRGSARGAAVAGAGAVVRQDRPDSTVSSVRSLGRELSVKGKVAWMTLLQSLRLSVLGRYPFGFACVSGFLMACMTIIVLGSLSTVVGDQFVSCNAGPSVAQHAVPTIGAILYGSVVGAAMVSWLGQMVARRELKTLWLLRASVGWPIVGMTWLGLAIGVVVGVLIAVASAGMTFYGNLGLERCADGLTPFGEIIVGVKGQGTWRWGLEIVTYAVIVATTCIRVATRGYVRSQRAVAEAIPKAIIWLSVLILLAKATMVLLES